MLDEIDEVDYSESDSDLDDLLRTESEEQKARELLTNERSLTFDEARQTLAVVSHLENRVAEANNQLRSSSSRANGAVKASTQEQQQATERIIDTRPVPSDQGIKRPAAAMADGDLSPKRRRDTADQHSGAHSDDESEQPPLPQNGASMLAAANEDEAGPSENEYTKCFDEVRGHVTPQLLANWLWVCANMIRGAKELAVREKDPGHFKRVLKSCVEIMSLILQSEAFNLVLYGSHRFYLLGAVEWARRQCAYIKAGPIERAIHAYAVQVARVATDAIPKPGWSVWYRSPTLGLQGSGKTLARIEANLATIMARSAAVLDSRLRVPDFVQSAFNSGTVSREILAPAERSTPSRATSAALERFSSWRNNLSFQIPEDADPQASAGGATGQTDGGPRTVGKGRLKSKVVKEPESDGDGGDSSAQNPDPMEEDPVSPRLKRGKERVSKGKIDRDYSMLKEPERNNTPERKRRGQEKEREPEPERKGTPERKRKGKEKEPEPEEEREVSPPKKKKQTYAEKAKTGASLPSVQESVGKFGNDGVKSRKGDDQNVMDYYLMKPQTEKEKKQWKDWVANRSSRGNFPGGVDKLSEQILTEGITLTVSECETSPEGEVLSATASVVELGLDVLGFFRFFPFGQPVYSQYRLHVGKLFLKTYIEAPKENDLSVVDLETFCNTDDVPELGKAYNRGVLTDLGLLTADDEATRVMTLRQLGLTSSRVAIQRKLGDCELHVPGTVVEAFCSNGRDFENAKGLLRELLRSGPQFEGLSKKGKAENDQSFEYIAELLSGNPPLDLLEPTNLPKPHPTTRAAEWSLKTGPITVAKKGANSTGPRSQPSEESDSEEEPLVVKKKVAHPSVDAPSAAGPSSKAPETPKSKPSGATPKQKRTPQPARANVTPPKPSRLETEKKKGPETSAAPAASAPVKRGTETVVVPERKPQLASPHAKSGLVEAARQNSDVHASGGGKTAKQPETSHEDVRAEEEQRIRARLEEEARAEEEQQARARLEKEARDAQEQADHQVALELVSELERPRKTVAEGSSAKISKLADPSLVVGQTKPDEEPSDAVPEVDGETGVEPNEAVPLPQLQSALDAATTRAVRLREDVLGHDVLGPSRTAQVLTTQLAESSQAGWQRRSVIVNSFQNIVTVTTITPRFVHTWSSPLDGAIDARTGELEPQDGDSWTFAGPVPRQFWTQLAPVS